MFDVDTKIYQCPGEPYPIGRAVHLGRLASFYLGCRDCPQRHDRGALDRSPVDPIAGARRHQQQAPIFDAEGVAAVRPNQLTNSDVRAIALAAGMTLTHHFDDSHAAQCGRPSIVLAGDQRPQSADWVASVAEGLSWAGCDVIDIGAATSGATVFAIERMQAAGGLLVGNPTCRPQLAGIKIWGTSARPISAGNGLEEIRQRFERGIDRPTRSAGALSCTSIESEYLRRFAPLYHALRPLRVALACESAPLARYLRTMCAALACEILDVEPEFGGSRTSKSHGTDATGLETPDAHLAEIVRTERAHLGVRIDGDGESCRALDERGHRVDTQSLLRLVRRHLAVVPSCCMFSSVEMEENALALEGREVFAGTRADVYDALLTSGRSVLADAADRLWYSAPRPTADALITVSLLLSILSQSDRPLSEVLDAGAAAR